MAAECKAAGHPRGVRGISRAATHVLAIVVLVVMAASLSLAWLGTHESPALWLLDGPWDDGRAFYEIATLGYSPSRPELCRELGFYPLVVRALVPFLGVWSLFTVSLCSSIAASVLVYSIAKNWYLSETLAFVFALVFSVARLPTFLVPAFTMRFPPMTVLTSIQGSEPLFLVLTLASFFAFKHQKWAAAFFLIGLSSITRASGILIAGGYCVWLLSSRRLRPACWGMVPLAFLLSHFAYYEATVGDFFAFFGGHGAYYEQGTLTVPFSDVLAAFTGGYRPLWETRVGWVVIYLYCIIALVYLARRELLVFLTTAPSFLLFVSLKGWALHARYYVTLWGIPLAYFVWWQDKHGRHSSCGSGEEPWPSAASGHPAPGP